MTLEVDNHAVQHSDNGKVSGRISNQKRSNGENPPQDTVERGSDLVPKMRRTHYPKEKVSCPTCHTPFTKNRPWHQFCSDSCRRKHHRTETRDAILTGMVATAKALSYSKDEFMAKIESMWK